MAYTWTHPVEAIRDHARLPISKTQPSENNPGSVREMPRSLLPKLRSKVGGRINVILYYKA